MLVNSIFQLAEGLGPGKPLMENIYQDFVH